MSAVLPSPVAAPELVRFSLDGCELDARADTRSQRHGVGVDDRIGESADPRNHRDGAVAKRAELCQAAGLEARRHEQRIGAALDDMRKRLVVADHGGDTARMPACGGHNASFERFFAGAQYRDLCAACGDGR